MKTMNVCKLNIYSDQEQLIEFINNEFKKGCSTTIMDHLSIPQCQNLILKCLEKGE